MTSDIKEANVPAYWELAVKNLYGLAIEDDELWSYFPDYPENVFPEKEFFFKVIATVQPNVLKQLISDALANWSSQIK